MAEEPHEPSYSEDGEPEEKEEPWLERVKVSYVSKEFGCPACGLRISGQDELAVAELPLETEQIEEREPEWEPDYGNC